MRCYIEATHKEAKVVDPWFLDAGAVDVVGQGVGGGDAADVFVHEAEFALDVPDERDGALVEVRQVDAAAEDAAAGVFWVRDGLAAQDGVGVVEDAVARAPVVVAGQVEARRAEDLDGLLQAGLVDAREVIEDYDQTSGNVRRVAASLNHNQPGNPDKLAAAIVELVDARTPPLRLPLGTDTLKAIAEKNAYVTQETETWKALSESTDFPT